MLIDAALGPGKPGLEGVIHTYALWYHRHDFVDLGGGTPMRDTVRCRLPAGWLGALAGGRLVAGDVERIFDYRRRTIDERFGGRSAHLRTRLDRRWPPGSAGRSAGRVADTKSYRGVILPISSDSRISTRRLS